MSHYLISADPSTPHVSANAINKRARRRGYMLVHDRHANWWSLYDRRLRLPIAGLDRATLAEIAHAVDSVPLPTKPTKTNGRPHRVGELIRALDQILEQQAKPQPQPTRADGGAR